MTALIMHSKRANIKRRLECQIRRLTRRMPS